MNHIHIRLIGVLFVIVCVASGAMLVAHAQETGDGSATIDYDYDTQEVNYELNDTLFDPYRVTALSEADTAPSIVVTGTNDPSKIQWADSGSHLYYTNGEGTIYQYAVSESYNIETISAINSMSVPASDGSTRIKDFQIGNNGQELIYFMADYSDGRSGTLRQVSFGTPYNIETIGTSDDHTLGSPAFYGYDLFEITNNGQTLYVSDSTQLRKTELTTAWDISTGNPSWGFPGGLPDEFDSFNDMQFESGNDETLTINPTESNEVVVLESSDGFQSSTVTSRTQVESIESFSWSESGQELFVSRSDAGTDMTLDRYTTNEYTGSLRDSNNNTIESIESVNQTGQIPYASDTYEGGIQLYWNAVTDSSYSGSSNVLDIYGSGEMSIREEQTNNLVTEPVNVTAYGEQSGIYSLDTSDGTVDITGLPDQAYTFSTDATGYTLRNKYVEELGNTESLYLLANDTDRVTSQFLLEDTTNTFTSDARLVIERSIEGNGNDWEEIYSDSFGVEGATVTLQEGVRYRISIENDEIRRTIGPYRATVSEQVTINPDSGDIDVDSEGGWSMGASYDGNNEHINVRYTDSEDITDSVSVSIYERGNESNVLVSEDTYVNPEDLRTEYQVPSQYNETNWIVSLEVDRGGETTVVSMQVGPTLDTVPSDLDPMWRNIISVIVILTFGLAFSALNRAVGAIVLALVGGAFWWIGWLVGATAGVLVTAYLFIAIGYGIYTKTVR